MRSEPAVFIRGLPWNLLVQIETRNGTEFLGCYVECNRNTAGELCLGGFWKSRTID